VNPAALPKFDSDQIGPWSRWQGNLNASLLVVGQDWADVPKLAENEGRPLARYRTNQTLVDLLAAAGLSVELPAAEDTLGVIFLTNAVLCLKLNSGAEIERNYYAHCQQFLRRIVEIVRPDIVVGMGGSAWQSVQQAFSVVPVTSLAAAVSTDTPVSLWPGGPKACGAYHCGSWGLRARPKELQLIDWRQIGRHLRRPSG
jgi:uracil-DNA glycosylase